MLTLRCSPDREDSYESLAGMIATPTGPMAKLLSEARRAAETSATVLIEGESGTGKELLARWLHRAGPRAPKPYVCVNCAAISETLAESELFGHEKGAFTGADTQRQGRFELAHEGTLLLDEIGEMSAKLQTKLLRVLEERVFERVGGVKEISVDVRILATTNRSLEAEVRKGSFRLDLLYRLNALHFILPPLRDRPDDIAPLARFFLDSLSKKHRTETKTLSSQALKLLMAYSWPGNIRQLRNVLERASIHAVRTQIQPEDLPPLKPQEPTARVADGITLAEMERQMIFEALRLVGGNQTAAALRLGITPRTLLNKLKRYRSSKAA